jgi:hypothetical protein
MPRKTNFTIPMGDVVEVVSESKKPKRGLRSTGKDVPSHSSEQTVSGKASRSRLKANSQTEGIQAHASGHPPHETEESHTLNFTETQEDDSHDGPAEEGHPQSYVCTKMPLYIIMTLILFRHLWTNG